MVDRLLRVHIQSQRAFGPRWTLSYNKSGHTVNLDKVCLTVSRMHAHPVQGLASLRTLDYNMGSVNDSGSFVCAWESRKPAAAIVLRR